MIRQAARIVFFPFVILWALLTSACAPEPAPADPWCEAFDLALECEPGEDGEPGHNAIAATVECADDAVAEVGLDSAISDDGIDLRSALLGAFGFADERTFDDAVERCGES